MIIHGYMKYGIVWYKVLLNFPLSHCMLLTKNRLPVGQKDVFVILHLLMYYLADNHSPTMMIGSPFSSLPVQFTTGRTSAITDMTTENVQVEQMTTRKIPHSSTISLGKLCN